MRLADRFVVAAALLAPLGCLGAGPALGSEPTSAPDGSQPQTAQIELLPNPGLRVGLGAATENLYLVKDTHCMSLFTGRVLGSFGMLWGNDKGLVAMPAGKVAYLRMVEDEPVGYRQRRSCENAGEFIPEAGHSYDAQQTSTSTACRLSLIDRATTLPPPTYRPFSPKVFCQSKK